MLVHNVCQESEVQPDPRLLVGAVWQCVRNDHRGWEVRILRASGAKVAFEQVAGPAKSRGRRLRLERAAFLSCYAPM